jgi:ferrous iron transport protein A
MSPITLLQAPLGAKVRITKFEGGQALSSKLRQYGLFIGDEARILRLAPFEGPVLIEVNGREIALGRSVAVHILVEQP